MAWVPIFVLVTLIAALLLRNALQSAANKKPWPYVARKLLTKPEQVLYYRLIEALPECVVLAQVQLSRVIEVRKGESSYQWRNRISQKSLDFVVCLPDSTVVAAIELDDSSHQKTHRRNADQTKDKALVDAGVKVLRWKVSELPNVNVIRTAFTS